MYEIHCETCGDVGFHPSRTGAELAAETHIKEMAHECRINSMTEARTHPFNRE